MTFKYYVPKLAEEITKAGNRAIREIVDNLNEYENEPFDKIEYLDKQNDNYEEEVVALQENIWLSEIERCTTNWFQTGEEFMNDFNMKQQIEVGCIVVYDINGPEMEVVEINGDYVKVEWENNFGSYHKDTLTVVKSLPEVKCEKNKKDGWCTDINRKYCSVLQDGNCPRDLYCEDGEWSVLLKPCASQINFDITSIFNKEDE